MHPGPLVSVIISNYNYERYLPAAIDSVLSQTYSRIETIVVDDGSTDRSRDVIARYGDRVLPILKENGGQTSALNAGFLRSRGDIVCFLDADDALFPMAIERAAAYFRAPDVVKVHWPLRVVDRKGRDTGRIHPPNELALGDLRDTVLRDGPDAAPYPPTSGNTWSRSFLERVLPLEGFESHVGRGGAGIDAILSGLAPLYGSIGRIDEPQGLYRHHGENVWAVLPFDERLQFDLTIYRHLCTLFAGHCRSLGLAVDSSRWKQTPWFCQIADALGDVDRFVPRGEPFILVDEEQWEIGTSKTYRAIPFLERDGTYWGRPDDDAHAIAEVERLHSSGVRFLVFAWPAFWWLDHYVGLVDYLQQRYSRVLSNERVVMFDMGPEGTVL